MGSRMVQVKCPSCKKPITGTAGTDLIFYCKECGAMHTRTAEGKADAIEYDISQFNILKENALLGKPHERLYMPVWQLQVQVNIFQENVAGGLISKLASMISNTGQNGILTIYVPAIDLDAEKFKYIAILLNTNNLVYTTVQKFDENTQRIPCTVTAKEAEELADFIVLSNEAEKPGVLQTLSYDMKVNRIRMVYLAFNRIDGNLVLAI